MKKKLMNGIVLCALLAVNFSAWGVIPAQAQPETIYQTFRGTTATGWVLLGNAVLTKNTVDAGNPDGGWLRLTDASASQAGAAVYNTPISAENVIAVEFNYATYGGSGADGFAFYMIDGTATPTLGTGGGWLGYYGIPGAFFAIGFNEYGSFGGQPSGTDNIAVRGSFDLLNSVVTTVETGSRVGTRHVKIVFHNNHLWVWVAEVPIIADYILPLTMPETIKMGFSGATGGITNIHELREFTAYFNQSGIIRVTEDGGLLPCGGTWASACSLQEAFSVAGSGDEIWVAEGVYKPGAASTDHFELIPGVPVYGGFGGEGDDARMDRDPAEHITILSGDIDNNDIDSDVDSIIENAADIRGNNAYHVLIGADGATLDGFTVTGGNASVGSCAENGCGGGMYNNSTDPVISHVNFKGNQAQIGGAMANYGPASPKISEVTFTNNSSVLYGGAIYSFGGNLEVSKVTFSGNHALRGGAMFNGAGSTTITNVTFSGNSASYGGGLLVLNITSTMTNVTFHGNEASYGGGIYNDDSSLIIRNSIFWGNIADLYGSQMYNANFSHPSISYSILLGDCPIDAICSNIITADPNLKALGDYGGFTPVHPLGFGSSAIDAGSMSYCPATDQRGVPRPIGTGCDIGAFEYHPPYFAKPSASGAADCSSWANACSLQTALTQALGGSEVWVGRGMHKPTEFITNRLATFQLKTGVSVYGGFDGVDDALPTDRDPAFNPTILSGDIDNNDTQTPVITDLDSVLGNTTNSYHVVTGADGATLDGFIITAGYATMGGSCPGWDCGGGIYNYLSSPTITNVTLSGNSAYNYGGGMYNYASSPTIRNVTFANNSAPDGGGIGYKYARNPRIVNSTFINNSATTGGGGGIYSYESNLWIANTTFHDNSAAVGSGIFLYYGSSTIFNSIFWENTDTSNTQISAITDTDLYISDSVVQDGFDGGTNIISADPMLGEPGDYGGSTLTIPLLPGSSAINTANGAFCYPFDQRGITRGNECDIGAFEFQQTYFAKPSESGYANCSSWPNACTLREALRYASTGSQVWAAVGVHKPTSEAANRAATFQLRGNISLYGGFDGVDDAYLADRDPGLNLTILSGDIDNDDSQTPTITDLATVTGNGTNSYHVVTGATGSIIDGFTITAGYAADDGSPCSGCGGGMYNLSVSPVIRETNFIGNYAIVGGGGVANFYNAPSIAAVTFSDNYAPSGGGMLNYFGSPAMSNVTFTGNGALNGGAMSNANTGNISIQNGTFNENQGNYGGAIFNNATGIVIQNSVFWNNSADIGTNIFSQSSNPELYDSVVQEGCPPGSTCLNVIVKDPFLGPLDFYGGFTQTIPLLPGSSAIDAGNMDFCPSTDQRGITRPQGGGCDIGALEFKDLFYTKPSPSGMGNCNNWSNACRLQTALAFATTGSQVWVAQGVHKPTQVTTDRAATFLLRYNVAVYGGFDGVDDALLTDRDPAEHLTILSGDIDNNDSQTPIITDLENVTGNQTNSYHVVIGTDESTLDGFTITAGYSFPGSCPGDACGGGMYNFNGGPTIRDVNFRGNAAIGGGGMANDSVSATIDRVTFDDNTAYSGGGMYIISSKLALTNVTFNNNRATFGDGGGMKNQYSSSSMKNVTFVGNHATFGGGAISNYYSDTGNQNSLFWGNTANEGSQIYLLNSTAILDHCVVQGGFSGTDIITTDPILGPLGNYGGFTLTIPLLHGSSAIDTADPATSLSNDQRGVSRPQGEGYDIGAFESDLKPIYLPLVIR